MKTIKIKKLSIEELSEINGGGIVEDTFELVVRTIIKIVNDTIKELADN